jgi:hypothetical protein
MYIMQSTEIFREAITYVEQVKKSLGPAGYSNFLQVLQNYTFSR